VANLAALAPTPEAFAADVTTVVDDPVAAFAYATRRADPGGLAVLSGRCGLAPDQTAATLAVALDGRVESDGCRSTRGNTTPASRRTRVVDIRIGRRRRAANDRTDTYVAGRGRMRSRSFA
jgi:hypothetical protein